MTSLTLAPAVANRGLRGDAPGIADGGMMKTRPRRRAPPPRRGAAVPVGGRWSSRQVRPPTGGVRPRRPAGTRCRGRWASRHRPRSTGGPSCRRCRVGSVLSVERHGGGRRGNRSAEEFGEGHGTGGPHHDVERDQGRHPAPQREPQPDRRARCHDECADDRGPVDARQHHLIWCAPISSTASNHSNSAMATGMIKRRRPSRGRRGVRTTQLDWSPRAGEAGGQLGVAIVRVAAPRRRRRAHLCARVTGSLD